MLKVTIKFEDVQKAFMEKYPDGYIGHPGAGYFVDDYGHKTRYAGDRTRVDVSYSKHGKLYMHRPQNNLQLAHSLGLMLDVAYGSDYYEFKRQFNYAKTALEQSDRIPLFSFVPTPMETLIARYNEAKAALEDFESKYSAVA